MQLGTDTEIEQGPAGAHFAWLVALHLYSDSPWPPLLVPCLFAADFSEWRSAALSFWHDGQHPPWSPAVLPLWQNLE
jgi:hypothetical protein